MDLKNLISKTTIDSNFTWKISKYKIILESKRKNGKLLKEKLNRYVDDKIFAMGLGIWLGEGTKEIEDEKRIEIINSESLIITKFLRFIKSIGIKDDRIRAKVILKLEEKNNIESKMKSAESFWINETGISKRNFWKTIIVVGKTKRLNRLEAGTLTIRILRGTFLFNLFTEWSKML